MMKEHIDQMKEKFSRNNSVKEKVFQKCSQCKFETNSDTELAEHMTELHVQKRLNCSKCKFECESETDMTEHQTKEHSNEQLFECDKCQFDTIIEVNFDAHMKRHQKENARNSNKICIYWNNGFCHNGEECAYIHEEIPECKFQDRCKNNRCSYFHNDKSWNNFLGRSLRRPVRRM